MLEKMDRMLELEEEILRILSRGEERRELKPLDALTESARSSEEDRYGD
jgi:hypothetical protein